MGTSLLGESCALLCAMGWALALVLFKRSGEHVQPLSLNLFKNVIGLILLAVTLLIVSDGIEALHRFMWKDFAILVLSGLVGFALADTILFHSLNLLGVGILSIVDCLYSPFIIFFAYLILEEELAVSDYVGIGLILVGVFISSRHTPPAGRTRGQLVFGILLGVLSLALMGFGIVIAKPELDVNDFPLIWATTLRLLAGTFALALFALASSQRREYWSVFRPSPIWKVSVPASILGAYLALILWMAAFKYAKASIAGALSQTSIIFAIILATLILKESFTRRKLIAVTIAAVGVVIVILA